VAATAQLVDCTIVSAPILWLIPMAGRAEPVREAA
jgi:hypothetical protein